VVERLRHDYAEPLDKPRLARLLKLSVRSLERRFVAAFGIGLLAYQRLLRMRRACQALVGGDDSITAIALSLGYGDHSHFTREFRRLYGIPPRAYRRRWSRQGSESLPLTTLA
jgi:AraC-like DNA-binding protein